VSKFLSSFQTDRGVYSWAAQPGGVGDIVWGTMSPHFWDQGGTGGTGGGPMKMIFPSIQQTVFIQYKSF